MTDMFHLVFQGSEANPHHRCDIISSSFILPWSSVLESHDLQNGENAKGH